MDQLNALKIFRTVVETGSFSGAAQRLNMSKSAVSKHVTALEHHLGIQLLNRTTRKLSLTEAGDTYLARTSRLLDDLAEADEAAREQRVAPRGNLRISAPVTFGLMHIRPLLGRFLAAYEHINIDLNLDDRFVDLIDERYDVALRIGDLADSSLRAKKLAETSLLVCAAPDYLEKHGTPQSAADLSDHTCLSYTGSNGGRTWQLGADTARVSGPITASNGDILMACGIDGHGIVYLPSFMVGDALKQGDLVRILPEQDTLLLGIYAVYPPTSYVPAATRVFIDHLSEAFSGGDIWI